MFGCVCVCALVIGSGSLQAHHSLAGVYDMKGEEEVQGTLTIIKFVNPHGSMHVAVKKPDAATFLPTRNGSPLGFLKSITKADGTVISISAGNPND
jgi:hypothetical protein